MPDGDNAHQVCGRRIFVQRDIARLAVGNDQLTQARMASQPSSDPHSKFAGGIRAVRRRLIRKVWKCPEQPEPGKVLAVLWRLDFPFFHPNDECVLLC